MLDRLQDNMATSPWVWLKICMVQPPKRMLIWMGGLLYMFYMETIRILLNYIYIINISIYPNTGTTGIPLNKNQFCGALWYTATLFLSRSQRISYRHTIYRNPTPEVVPCFASFASANVDAQMHHQSQHWWSWIPTLSTLVDHSTSAAAITNHQLCHAEKNCIIIIGSLKDSRKSWVNHFWNHTS